MNPVAKASSFQSPSSRGAPFQSSVVGPQSSTNRLPDPSTINNQQSTGLRVSLLTGGDDRPYVLGLTEALTSSGLSVDVIGSNNLSLPELLSNPSVNFLNLRGDQSTNAGPMRKATRILKYYSRLIAYVTRATSPILHILWNNKFELFDRTLLMFYYKALGKRVVFTAHNVNARRRDGCDSWWNRFSLKIQYHLVDHILVHTNKMKEELVGDFRVREAKVSVIPFGINNTAPNSELASADARQSFGFSPYDKVLLCYGQIAPYKGLEFVVAALAQLLRSDRSYKLIIAGKPKWNDTYWKRIERSIDEFGISDHVIRRIYHVPDEETELYFKAADALILSYTQIFQSGVIFLAYSFGLPVIAANVGSLADAIVEGETGFVFESQNSSDLAHKIEEYFRVALHRDLDDRRLEIKRYANERYSWDKVAAITKNVYLSLLAN